MPRVLHVLSQRPAHTGSGITLEALVRHAAVAGWEQMVACGVPAEDPRPVVGGLVAARVRPLVFGASGELDFPLPGMSDVMPYRSSVFSRLGGEQVDRYRTAWRRHLAALVAELRPDVIHSHHLWLVSALLKDVAPDTPVVTHGHATGLRQMALCPHLAPEVCRQVRRNDRFCVLHQGQVAQVTAALDIPADRVRVVGAGYREDLFHPRGRAVDAQPTIVYVGKYSAAKGLPWLLEAVERLAPDWPGLHLHVAGSGAGPEAEALRLRMESKASLVTLHGHLGQPELAALLRRSRVFALPSLYEGLPLVVVEALACGCRPVCTALPGIVGELAPALGDALTLVDPPRLVGPDTPRPEDLPAFVARLAAALDAALRRPALDTPTLAPFTWREVFTRVEALWHELGTGSPPPTTRNN